MFITPFLELAFMTTDIAQYNILIIHNVLKRFDWHEDVIWRHSVKFIDTCNPNFINFSLKALFYTPNFSWAKPNTLN